jgi:hypothetical protein
VTHRWPSLRAEAGGWPPGVRRGEHISSHGTHLRLLRPFLIDWFGLTLSRVKHIIREARAIQL